MNKATREVSAVSKEHTVDFRTEARESAPLPRKILYEPQTE